MSIIRIEKTSQYSVISNACANDARLSWKSKGVFLYLMTKPNHWHIKTDGLLKASTDGRDATRKALSELEKLGYLKRTKRRGEDGKWVWDSILYEDPGQVSFGNQDGKSGLVDEPEVETKPSDGKPVDGETVAGKAVALVTTDLINTEEEKKEKKADPNGPAAKRALDRFHEISLRLTGVKPDINIMAFLGAAKGAFRRGNTEELVNRAMDLFFKDPSKARGGFSSKSFWGDFSKYHLGANGVKFREGAQKDAALDERDARVLSKLQGHENGSEKKAITG